MNAIHLWGCIPLCRFDMLFSSYLPVWCKSELLLFGSAASCKVEKEETCRLKWGETRLQPDPFLRGGPKLITKFVIHAVICQTRINQDSLGDFLMDSLGLITILVTPLNQQTGDPMNPGTLRRPLHHSFRGALHHPLGPPTFSPTFGAAKAENLLGADQDLSSLGCIGI